MEEDSTLQGGDKLMPNIDNMKRSKKTATNIHTDGEVVAVIS